MHLSSTVSLVETTTVSHLDTFSAFYQAKLWSHCDLYSLLCSHRDHSEISLYLRKSCLLKPFKLFPLLLQGMIFLSWPTRLNAPVFPSLSPSLPGFISPLSVLSMCHPAPAGCLPFPPPSDGELLDVLCLPGPPWNSEHASQTSWSNPSSLLHILPAWYWFPLEYLPPPVITQLLLFVWVFFFITVCLP